MRKNSRHNKRMSRPLTEEMVKTVIKRNNFWLAFQKICEKIGKRKEYFLYARGRDMDATPQQRHRFISKVTRLLAFNYDVHRCPDPCTNNRLKPAEMAGSEPLIYPPDWSEAW